MSLQYNSFVDRKFIEELQRFDSDIDFDYGYSRLERSANAGFPYALDRFNGSKNLKTSRKRDAFITAVPVAYSLYYNEHETYDNYWMLGSRGKLLTDDKPDAARLIEFQGLHEILAANKWSVPLSDLFVRNKYKANIAIGHSWYYGEAIKVFQHLCSGDNYNSFKYATVDISSWDASLSADLLKIPRDFYIDMFKDLLKKKEIDLDHYLRLTKNVMKSYNKMINAKFLLPETGEIQETIGGMKSGWVLTAQDNSIIHDYLIRDFQKKFGYKFSHQVYGDDVIFCFADNVDYSKFKVDISKHYKTFNLNISQMDQQLRNFEDSEFLSKKIIKGPKFYYPSRSTCDTFERILYPDCY